MPGFFCLSIYYFFLPFITSHNTSATTMNTRKKAHHIPALKIPETTSQPGNKVTARASRKKRGIRFIYHCLTHQLKISCQGGMTPGQ